MMMDEVEHVLRAAGEIVGDNQFITIGSQSLHGKFPDMPDNLCLSHEIDLISKNKSNRTEFLNTIGQDSQFHETFGY